MIAQQLKAAEQLQRLRVEMESQETERRVKIRVQSYDECHLGRSYAYRDVSPQRRAGQSAIRVLFVEEENTELPPMGEYDSRNCDQTQVEINLILERLRNPRGHALLRSCSENWSETAQAHAWPQPGPTGQHLVRRVAGFRRGSVTAF